MRSVNRDHICPNADNDSIEANLVNSFLQIGTSYQLEKRCKHWHATCIASGWGEQDKAVPMINSTELIVTCTFMH